MSLAMFECSFIYHAGEAEKIKVFKVLPYLVSNVVEVEILKPS